MATKTLGVVIPTHNRSAALLTCLSHLENQTFTEFEVIVVDDGSTDDTAEQIERYQSRTPLSLRYLRQENGGPAKARNTGISLLQSQVCVMLGDDIFASPTLLEKHLAVHRQYEDMRVAALGFTRWSTHGQEVTPFMHWLDENNVQFNYPRLLTGTKPDWTDFYTSNLSVKTELVRRYPFNEVFPYAAMEDMELGYRIKKCIGLELKFIPDAVADHLHPTTFRKHCARMVRVGYSCGLFYDLWPEQRPSHRGLRERILDVIAHSPRLLDLLTDVFSRFEGKIDPRKTPLPYLFFYRAHFAVGLQGQLKSAKQRGQAEPIARPV